jgi:hypothetical protein
MKATIKKIRKLGYEYPRFEVYAGDDFARCFNFKENVPEDDIWSEKVNFAKALKVAHEIENFPTESKDGRLSITMYETPDSLTENPKP